MNERDSLIKEIEQEQEQIQMQIVKEKSVMDIALFNMLLASFVLGFIVGAVVIHYYPGVFIWLQ